MGECNLGSCGRPQDPITDHLTVRPVDKRTALVTGASSGIGLRIVERLVNAGYIVCVTGRDEAKLRAALSSVDESNLRFLIADLAVTDDCMRVAREALSAFGGRLDVLVNNAGGAILGQPWGSATVESFDWTMAINVRAPFLLTNACADALASTEGCVVNLSSIAASRPLAGAAAYCASKAAVEMLTKSAALELAPRRVRVNAIAPGTIQTRFHVAGGMDADLAKAYYSASSQTHPIGRIGDVDDIAEMALFLVDKARSGVAACVSHFCGSYCSVGGSARGTSPGGHFTSLVSRAAGFITGSIMLVDGGRLLTSATAPQMAAAART